MHPDQITIHWFRRDLRTEDNASLFHALQSGYPVLPIFIFDKDILEKLTFQEDARVQFIHQQVTLLKAQFESLGSTLLVCHGTVEEAWQTILNNYNVQEVHINRDYEPDAIRRDQKVRDMLAEHGIKIKHHKDQVIFDRHEVVKDDGKPYTVFTPYSKKWKSLLTEAQLLSFETASHFTNLYQTVASSMPNLETLGFTKSKIAIPEKALNINIIKDYDKTRDIPSIRGTSRMSIHLRFGTISIRHLVCIAMKENGKWLDELIWREFYQMILYHFPHTINQSFKPAYDRIIWRNDETEFDLWCAGKTGYPIVDAGMRELNATGFMHNRVRMIVASFLVKHLLIDWRWGERYFAERLLDFELASNVGGWQWAAGSGCDAAPYFRIFNPTLQTARFDAEHRYIKTWVPEYSPSGYIAPIVNHAMARERCLSVFKKALIA